MVNRTAPIFLALGVFFCILQAVYYPYLTVPNVEIAWWQVGWMAAIGFYAGFPVMLLAESVCQEVVVWVAAAIWSALIWLGLKSKLGRSRN